MKTTTTIFLVDEELKEQTEQEQVEQQSYRPLRTMDSKTFSSIVSRAKYQVRMLNEGCSRGDSHRKHIFVRFDYLSKMNWRKGDRITCDKCNKNIEMNDEMFIHRRRSYNRFFHSGCAAILNLI